MQDSITKNRTFNIEMVAGDTLAFGLKINGIGQDLSEAYFTCRQSETSASVLFQKSIGDGIEKVQAESTDDTRVYRVRVAPEDTEELAAGQYWYAFKIFVDSDSWTLLRGVLELKTNVGGSAE